MVPNKSHVEIWHDPLARSAHYRNLITCSCVWICAVCAAKISEARRMEMKFVVNNAQASLGLSPVLVTYTMQHNSRETLQKTLDDLVDAYKAQTSGGGWQQIREKHHLSGYIRAIEMTHGTNGWHPHIHVLLLADSNLDVLGDELSYRWIAILKTLGRAGKEGIACDVRVSNDAIVDYIAKFGHEPIDGEFTKKQYWSMEHEVAKASSKRSSKGRNPFQILLDTQSGDKSSMALWREYAKVSKGRRQLEWSRIPNLRELFGLYEKSDEEIMDTHDKSSVLLARLTVDEWQAVLRCGAVVTLLQIAAEGSIIELREFLSDIGADWNNSSKS